jgi:hypothetical protein
MGFNGFDRYTLVRLKPAASRAGSRESERNPVPTAEENRTLQNGLQVFQGTWKFDLCDSILWRTPLSEIRESWKWAIEGREMTWTRAGKESVRLYFTIDPTKEPNQRCRGVYLTSRHEVAICFQEPGANVDRPKYLGSKPGSHHTAMTLVPVRIQPVAEEIEATKCSDGDWTSLTACGKS